MHWSRKVEAYVTSVFGDAPDTLAWAAQQEDTIDYTKIDDDPEIAVSAREAEDLGIQLYSLLIGITDGESFDLVIGSGPSKGLEAWRRLAKRWDP